MPPSSRSWKALASVTAHRAVSLDQPRGEDDERTAADWGAADDPGYAHIEDNALAEQLLRTLPDRERTILHLRFTHELTQAEIGTQLGLSQMHVSRLIRRSINLLQDASNASRTPL